VSPAALCWQNQEWMPTTWLQSMSRVTALNELSHGGCLELRTAVAYPSSDKFNRHFSYFVDTNSAVVHSERSRNFEQVFKSI
jgi:hypothetical protein